MSGFTQHIDSPFPDENILFNSASGLTGQQFQKNQLALQGAQMDLSAADHEQVARLSAALLNEPDVAKRADLYSRGVGMLQAQNLAKYAPPTLPDESTLRMLAAQGVSSEKQDQYGAGRTAAQGALGALGIGSTGTGAGTTVAPGTAAAPSTIEPTALTSATAVRDGLIKRGMDPVTATAFAANKLHESGATLDSGPGDGGVSQGNFMWNGDRNTEYQQLYGHTPQGAPLDEQLDFVMHELNGKESNARDAINAAQGVDAKAAAISRYYLRPKDVVGETQRRAATALQLQRQLAATAQPGAPGGATAPGVAMGDATRPDLAPPPPGGTAGIPAPYQATGGGIGAVLGGTPRTARPAGPAGAPIVTDQPAGGAVVAGPAGTAVVGQPTPSSAAVPGNVGAINAGIARAGGAPAQAATPEPGWGTVIGSYGPQNTLAPPPAPATTATAPAATTPAPAPQVPLLDLKPFGLTAQQEAAAKIAFAQPMTPAAATALTAHYQQLAAANVASNNAASQTNFERQRQAQADARQTVQDQAAAQHQAVEEKRQAEQLQLSREAGVRAAEEATQKAKAANRPLQGTDIAAQHENILNELAPKIRDGTATEAEQRLYAGSYYAMQQAGGQALQITDPNDPGGTIAATITRRLPPQFPEPPGGALPQVLTTPGAAKAPQMSAPQSLAAGFADRMRNVLPIISDTSQAAMNRWQVLLGKAPVVGNSLVTPEFQQHLQAERDFINAVLRRESGAAISEPEFINARQQYIPQPGDKEPVLAQKAKNRETVMANLVRDAGPAYRPPSGDAVKSPAATTPSRVIRYDHNGKRIEE